MLFCYLEKYIIRYTRDVSYEMFESECFILFKLGLFFTVEIFGCFILTRHLLIPWSGGAFAPLGPFLCPITEEKKWPIAPKPGP